MANEAVGDARKKLAYDESVRSLTQQESVLDALRSRTGILLTAISITATFLGSRALDAPGSISTWSWIAIGFFASAGAFALAVLWPRANWCFAANPISMTMWRATTRRPSTKCMKNLPATIGATGRGTQSD